MTLETRQSLSTGLVNALQDLIQANIDSRDGYRQAAQGLEDLTLQSAFEQIAEDRDRQADDLARFVSWSGETPRRSGSVAAIVYRAWSSIRELLSTDNRHAMLCEAERGEDAIRNAYEDALNRSVGSAANDILVQHYAAVCNTHDRIRDLRDACQACG